MIRIAKPILGKEEEEAVLGVLRSGHIAQGPKVKEFEETFAEYCGVKHCVAVSSGTSALVTALMANGINSGEVITSSFTFIASANSILACGARPVFTDIDEETYNMDIESLKEKINSKTKAIMPVHLFGYPCDMKAIMEIAEDKNLIVIEDSCQSHGAAISGKKVGSFGIGCFSFYPTKNMTTAEGGMISTNDEKVNEKARMIRHHGSKEVYKHEILGYNFRMTDIEASIGIEQLKKLEYFIERRIKNAEYLSKNLENLKIPKVEKNYKHSYSVYTVKTEGNRDKIVEGIKKEGIDAGIYYPLPAYKQKIYVDLKYNDKLKNVERVCKEVFSLPVLPDLTKEELDKIIEVVNRLC